MGNIQNKSEKCGIMKSDAELRPFMSNLMKFRAKRLLITSHISAHLDDLCLAASKN